MDTNDDDDVQLLDDLDIDSSRLDVPLDKKNHKTSIQKSTDVQDSASDSIFAPLDRLFIRYESHGSQVSLGSVDKKKITKDSRLLIVLLVAVILVTFAVGITFGYLFFHSKALCPSHCYKCSAPDVCVKCVKPLYAFNGNCIACPMNCTECEHKDALQCSKCADGYHHGEKHSCPSCMIGCAHCKSSSKCNKCYDGWKKEGDKCSFAGLNAWSVLLTGGLSTPTVDIISFHDLSNCHIPHLPESRRFAFASTYKQNFIFCGGEDVTYVPKSECWIFKTKDRNAIWTSFPPLPFPIIRATLTNINENLFIVGGATTEQVGQLNSIYTYNETVQNWTRISKILPADVDGHCTLALANNMIILGGWFYTRNATYSLITDTEWTHLPKMNKNRWGHACEIIVRNDEMFIYVVGGLNDQYTGEYLNWNHPNSWTSISGNMSINRPNYPTLAFMENHLIVIGGTLDIHQTEIFDFQNETWSYYDVTPAIQQRQDGTSFEISDISLLNCKSY